MDGLEGAAFHLAERINLVVVAKADADRLSTYAQERHWRNIRMVSSKNNTFNRDYHAGTSDGVQIPLLHVFTKDEDGIHHRWTSEQIFVRGDSRAMDAIWPIFGALDLTPRTAGIWPPIPRCSIRPVTFGDVKPAGPDFVRGPDQLLHVRLRARISATDSH